LTFLSIDIATERATIFYLNLEISSEYFNDSQRDTQWSNGASIHFSSWYYVNIT